MELSGSKEGNILCSAALVRQRARRPSSLTAGRAREGPSDPFSNQHLNRPRQREHELRMTSPRWQRLCKGRNRGLPPSLLPVILQKKKTKSQYSFLLNVPPRPSFLLSSETIAKPNAVQWKQPRTDPTGCCFVWQKL